MNNEQFLYWLQGMLEYTNIGSLSEADIRNKLQGIKDHLQLVFKKETPPVKTPFEKQKKVGPIEPSEALKKAFEDMRKGATENPKPSVRPNWRYNPNPSYGPDYWLERPGFGDRVDQWGIDHGMKPGVLYC